MSDQAVLRPEEPVNAPYVLIVSTMLAIVAMAMVSIWASQPVS